MKLTGEVKLGDLIASYAADKLRSRVIYSGEGNAVLIVVDCGVQEQGWQKLRLLASRKFRLAWPYRTDIRSKGCLHRSPIL